VRSRAETERAPAWSAASRYRLGDVVAEPVRQELVGVAEVPVGCSFVAERRVHPAGL
jgi:hypothetical protein